MSIIIYIIINREYTHLNRNVIMLLAHTFKRNFYTKRFTEFYLDFYNCYIRD